MRKPGENTLKKFKITIINRLPNCLFFSYFSEQVYVFIHGHFLNDLNNHMPFGYRKKEKRKNQFIKCYIGFHEIDIFLRCRWYDR